MVNVVKAGFNRMQRSDAGRGNGNAKSFQRRRHVKAKIVNPPQNFLGIAGREVALVAGEQGRRSAGIKHVLDFRERMVGVLQRDQQMLLLGGIEQLIFGRMRWFHRMPFQ
jgi:hypothetical protein